MAKWEPSEKYLKLAERHPVLLLPHVMEGRTLREAWSAGNYYCLRNAEIGFNLEYPSSQSPEETVALARINFDSLLRPGMVFEVWRYLPGSRIGASVVESAGTYTVPE